MAGGSIPACAGEPESWTPIETEEEVYPRVCGGTTCVAGSTRAARGLSPRVRGNPDGRRGRRCGQRSIPACAGEPVAVALRASVVGVYPRVCGGTLIGKAFG